MAKGTLHTCHVQDPETGSWFWKPGLRLMSHKVPGRGARGFEGGVGQGQEKQEVKVAQGQGHEPRAEVSLETGKGADSL